MLLRPPNTNSKTTKNEKEQDTVYHFIFPSRLKDRSRSYIENKAIVLVREEKIPRKSIAFAKLGRI